MKKKTVLRRAIQYYIDDVHFDGCDTVVSGWALSSNGPVSIEAKDADVGESFAREDVLRRLGRLSSEAMVGFILRFAGKRFWMRLVFSDGIQSRYVYLHPFDFWWRSVKRLIRHLSSVVRYLKWENIPRAKIFLEIYGWRTLLKAMLGVLKGSQAPLYSDWYARRKPDAKQLQSQRQRPIQPGLHPLISIVLDGQNPWDKELMASAQSVVRQTYVHWEVLLMTSAEKPLSDAFLETIFSVFSMHHVEICMLEKGQVGIDEVMARSKGDYVLFLPAGDRLGEEALYVLAEEVEKNAADILYADEDHMDPSGRYAFAPWCKPDFSPDMLRSMPYIGYACLYARTLLQQLAVTYPVFDEAGLYDLLLQATEKAEQIRHLPVILYHRQGRASVYEKGYKNDEAMYRVLQTHLQRLGLDGIAGPSLAQGTYRIQYALIKNPLVSIIIPNKDHKEDLEKCIQSILEKTTYDPYEILIVENNSVEQSTFDYYRDLNRYGDRIRILDWSGPFNYASINNMAARKAKGEFLMLLNNDVSVITPAWLEEMLMFAQRQDVGVVGAKLYYQDNTVQHGGIILGVGGLAGHAHRYAPKSDHGYMNRLSIVHNLSALTAACMMLEKRKFLEVDGFDEAYVVAVNDVDLSMKLREKGYLNIFTPYAELYHDESKSRGPDDTPEKRRQFMLERERFFARWGKDLHDPYYNRNLTRAREDFSLTRTWEER